MSSLDSLTPLYTIKKNQSSYEACRHWQRTHTDRKDGSEFLTRRLRNWLRVSSSFGEFDTGCRGTNSCCFDSKTYRLVGFNFVSRHKTQNYPLAHLQTPRMCPARYLKLFHYSWHIENIMRGVEGVTLKQGAKQLAMFIFLFALRRMSETRSTSCNASSPSRVRLLSLTVDSPIQSTIPRGRGRPQSYQFFTDCFYNNFFMQHNGHFKTLSKLFKEIIDPHRDKKHAWM